MKEEILMKLNNGCSLESLFDSELSWLLNEVSNNPDVLKGEYIYE